jgi:hypothetical protein
MTDLEEDWQELRLRMPVGTTGELLDDLVEDWDVLQGKNSWFVALYDAQKKLIPGSIKRVDDAQLREDIFWQEVPCGGTVHFTGYWSRFQRRQFARFEKPIDLSPGQSFGVKLQFGWTSVPNIFTFSSSNSGTNINSTTTFTIPSGINQTSTTNFSITFT